MLFVGELGAKRNWDKSQERGGDGEQEVPKLGKIGPGGFRPSGVFLDG